MKYAWCLTPSRRQPLTRIAKGHCDRQRPAGGKGERAPRSAETLCGAGGRGRDERGDRSCLRCLAQRGARTVPSRDRRPGSRAGEAYRRQRAQSTLPFGSYARDACPSMREVVPPISYETMGGTLKNELASWRQVQRGYPPGRDGLRDDPWERGWKSKASRMIRVIRGAAGAHSPICSPRGRGIPCL